MNTPVNFELAKLLKEKGYEGNKSPLWYYKDGTLHNTPTSGYRGLKCWNTWQATQGVRWDAPTISEVVMWLYEKHGIWIDVSPSMTFKDGNLKKYEEKSFSFLYSIKYGTEELFLANSNKPLVFQKGFNSPTEAYEAAIEYTLKNLIK